MRNLWLKTLLLCSACLAIPLQAQTPTQSTSKNFEGFPSLRSEVLTQIAGATKRIRLVTDFLSDGEIVTALYIAQYRKVNVQVLLGAARATHALSRLNYLKAQSIPVWLRPAHFNGQHATILLIDDKLYALNAELDYLARHRKFTLTQLPDTQVQGFVDGFDKVTTTGVSPNARPAPLVGRPGATGRPRPEYRRPQGGSAPIAEQEAEDAGALNRGPYRYKRVKEKPTSGIPTKLPKTTILQDRARSAEHSDNH